VLTVEEKDAWRLYVSGLLATGLSFNRNPKTIAETLKGMSLKTDEEVRSILASRKAFEIENAKYVFEKARANYIAVGGKE
jgi:hypothetical protein